MSLAKIIGIIIAIPILILTVIPMIIQFFAEGVVIDSLLSAFGVHPIIGAAISIGGTIIFVVSLIAIGKSILGL